MSVNTRAGMALVGLLVALIVLLLAVFAFYSYVNMRSVHGKREVTLERLQILQDALQRYLVDCGGTLPTQKQGLPALLKKPETRPIPRGWRGPYVLDPAVLRDGWGRPFKYYCPGGGLRDDPQRLRPYDLASYGQDGAEGGEGLDRDLCSWDRTTLLP